MTGKKNSHYQPAQIGFVGHQPAQIGFVGHQPAPLGFVGFIAWGPPAASSGKAVASSGRRKLNCTDAFESQSSTKAVNKRPGGGSSSKLTKTVKGGGFVDKRSGNHGHKQEVNYKTSVKVKDKARGCTTEYETQVKCKKTTTYNAPKKIKADPKPFSY